MKRLAACLFVLAAALSATPTFAAPQWIELPDLAYARGGHSATLLRDGRVLVAGSSFFSQLGGGTAEIFDPKTRTWSAPIPMTKAHGNHAAALLPDGRVLLVSGYLDLSNDISRFVDIFDPATNTFSEGPKSLRSHSYAPATVLADGRVLIAGGYNALNKSEVFDPATMTWTAADNALIQSNFYHPAALLPDGRAIVPGGGYDTNSMYISFAYVEIYDPIANSWSHGAPLKHDRRWHTATELADGRVMAAGGVVGGDYQDVGKSLSSVEIYDGAANQWTSAPDLAVARHRHAALRLASGAVLVTGGIDPTASVIESAEVWDGAAWHFTTPMHVPRESHTMTLLADGTVLVVGGGFQNSAELYVPDPDGTPCADGVACKSGFCVDGVCCESACETGCRYCNIPGYEGRCLAPCTGPGHLLTCGEGPSGCADRESCEATSCGAYRCDQEAGSCPTACQSVADCAPGYACDLEGACVAPPEIVVGEEGACAATPMDAPGSRVGPLLALGALCALRLRRRRR
ncbi:MAG: hypothetical protein U0441_24850 [Polyangiaceae bacterium]